METQFLGCCCVDDNDVTNSHNQPYPLQQKKHRKYLHSQFCDANRTKQQNHQIENVRIRTYLIRKYFERPKIICFYH